MLSSCFLTKGNRPMKMSATSRLSACRLDDCYLCGAARVAPATGLVANWTLNVGAPGTTVGDGATIADLTGNGYNAAVSVIGTDTLTSVAGMIGNGLQFTASSGTNNADYVRRRTRYRTATAAISPSATRTWKRLASGRAFPAGPGIGIMP